VQREYTTFDMRKLLELVESFEPPGEFIRCPETEPFSAETYG
jgi:hypothetical protein